MKTIPLLLCDFYKTVHSEQYPKNLTKMVSYFTPRVSRIDGQNEIVMFGLQYFIKEYLVKYFNDNFFNKPIEEVLNEYNRILSHTLGRGCYDDNKIKNLWELGYLPLQIKAIAEGTRVPIHVPMIEISNTHPNFVWVVNTIESLMSCTLWHSMISANVGVKYREIVNKWFDKTVDDNIPRNRALGDFSMRGQESLESAIKSSAGFCLSFLNTATVPTIPWLEEYYNCDCTKEDVVYGAISTEHSVMCSNYAIDGEEEKMVKRLLTEIYPNNSFSMVSDSYDYWNLVQNILPRCKEEIENHNGTILIRGDSGNPVDIICGKEIIEVDDYDSKHFTEDTDMWVKSVVQDYNIDNKTILYVRQNKNLYQLTIFPKRSYECVGWTDNNYEFIENWDYKLDKIEYTPEILGTVEILWNEFGGTINSKGYKVLNPKIKVIYGDSITVQRCEEIYRRLEEKGFASNNVVLGVGSFSMECIEGSDGNLSPFTRDTFGIAVKATYAEDENGKPIMIYKNPKTDTGHFKKSQKGCCLVYKEDGEIKYSDKHTFEEVDNHSDNILNTVFFNGKTYEFTLKNIRRNLWGDKF